MIDDEDVLDFLSHHGIKGQKWGVRKKEDTGGEQTAFQKDLAAHPQRPLTKEEKANIANSKKKFEAQREQSDEDHQGFHLTKKEVAIGLGVGAAVGVVGGVVIAKKLGAKSSAKDLAALYPAFDGSKPFSADMYKKATEDVQRFGTDVPDWIKGYSGKSMSSLDYQGITANSVGRVWGSGNYITPGSFDQKATTFPVGHQFYRVTHAVEKSFNDATYMVGSREDLARYELGWQGGTTNVVSFHAKQPIRVPDLVTRLEATREAMLARGDPPNTITPSRVIGTYSNVSGGSWNDKTGKAIIGNLKRKGYHALVDDMDAGIYGEMPMVLFDKTRVTDKLTTLAKDVSITDMRSILTEIPNRR